MSRHVIALLAAAGLAGVVEIHRTTMDGGVMRMRPVAAIELPAGQAVELKPGGERQPVTIQAPVRALTAPAHGPRRH